MADAVRCERDIKALGTRTSKLERMAARLGTASESADLFDRITDLISTSRDEIGSLIRRLRLLSPGRARDKLIATFHRHAKALRRVAERIDADEQERQPSQSVGSTSSLQRQVQDQQESKAVVLEDVQRADDMAARAQKLRQLNHDVEDLAVMFQDMQMLVDGQQPLVDQIVVNVEEAKDTTGEAQQELQQAAAYSLASRKRYLCIAITCGLILAVVGVIAWAVTRN